MYFIRCVVCTYKTDTFTQMNRNYPMTHCFIAPTAPTNLSYFANILECDSVNITWEAVSTDGLYGV